MSKIVTCTLLSSSKLEFSNSRLNVLFRPLGVIFEPIYVDQEGLRGFLKKLVKVKDGVVFVNLPLGLKLPLFILLILLFKPRKVVLFIPPHYSYEVHDLRLIVSIVVIRILITLFKLIKSRVLVVYPTIFEKKVFHRLSFGLSSVFLPIYSSTGRSVTSVPSVSGGLTILFLPNNQLDLVLAVDIYSVLRKTFGNVKLVLMDPTHQLNICVSSPGLICISSDNYRELVNNVDIVILKYTGDYANQILFDISHDTKIILVDHKVGLSYYLRDSGFINIVIVDKWDPDRVLSNILLTINTFDAIKKNLLSIKTVELNPDFGLSYVMNFIVE